MNSLIGWVSGYDQISKTVDGGDTWTIQQISEADEAIDVTFVDDKNGLAVYANNIILATADGGENWIPQNFTDLTQLLTWADSSRKVRGVFAYDTTSAWAVGYGGTIMTNTASTAPAPAPQPTVSWQSRFLFWWWLRQFFCRFTSMGN